MDRVLKLLLDLKLTAQLECRAGDSEACKLLLDLERAIRKLEATK